MRKHLWAVPLLLAGGASAAGDADFVRALTVVRAPRPVVRGAAAAAPVEGTVLRDVTTVVPVDLNPSTVKCSAADYQAPMLKVLVPALAELTILNHRNTREGAPCVSAGQCWQTGPEAVLRHGEGVIQVPARVVLRKLAEADGETCRVSLVETVTMTIRGLDFFHERRHEVAERVLEDCR